MYLRALFLVFIFKVFQASANDCYTYISVPSPFTCSSSGSYSASTSLTRLVQKSSKELTVAISIKPTSLCGMSSDFNFLTVSINTSAGRKKVMMMKYLFGSGSIAFNSEDSSSTIKTALTQPVTFTNNPMNLFVSVDLASNTFAAGVLTSSGNSDQTITTVSYGSSWTFDSTSLISVCSDYDGSDAIACTVDKLKVAYSFFSSSAIVNTANSVSLIGDYKLNDGAGSTIAVNTQTAAGSLASATISATSPTWTSNAGLKFTSASQYLMLSAFASYASDQFIQKSVAFTFYIKIDSVPSTESTILYYFIYNNPPASFKLLITSNMKLKTSMGTSNAEGTSVLTQGKWYQVYVSFFVAPSNFGGALVQINGGSVESSFYTTSATLLTAFSTSDMVLVGAGFIGQLRRFQVYSPAAFELSSESCNPTTCEVNIGFTDPPTCIETICKTSGTYISFGTCESCPDGCATCDPTTCYTCSSGYYLTAGTCSECPNHCTSCTDSQTCQTCDSGFGLYNDLCKICPSGTTLTPDQICEEFSETLKDAMSVSQTLNAALAQVVNIISKGSSISLSASIASKVFSQIKHFDIEYSGKLQVALLTWDSNFVSLGLTPDLSDTTIDKIPSRYVPEIFEKYGVSSSFLVNFWENLGVIIFATVLWMIFKGLELLFGSQNEPKLALNSKRIRVMAQNFLISTLYECYGDIVLFSLIEYRSFEFCWNLSLLSFIISIILLLTMFICFWYQVNLLLNYQKLKKQDSKILENFKKTNEGNQVLFNDFQDYSLTPQLYLFILSGRDIIISLLLATMFDYPIFQTVIALLLSLVMIAYLFSKKPVEGKFDMIQILFFEIITLAVGICILINAIATSSQISIGKTLISFNMIFNITTAILMLIGIFSLLKEAYDYYNTRKTKNRKIFHLHDRFQNPSSNDSESPPLKQKTQFDLSQMSSNQRFNINLDSEVESFQQGSLDIDISPPRQLHPSHYSLNPHPSNYSQHSSNQQLRINRNLSRIAQHGPMIQPSHHQVRIPEQAERFANRQRPFRQDNSSFTDHQYMDQQMNHQQPRANGPNRGNSLRKRRVLPIANFEDPEIPLRFRRR